MTVQVWWRLEWRIEHFRNRSEHTRTHQFMVERGTIVPLWPLFEQRQHIVPNNLTWLLNFHWKSIKDYTSDSYANRICYNSSKAHRALTRMLLKKRFVIRDLYIWRMGHKPNYERSKVKPYTYQIRCVWYSGMATRYIYMRRMRLRIFPLLCECF